MNLEIVKLLSKFLEKQSNEEQSQGSQIPECMSQKVNFQERKD